MLLPHPTLSIAGDRYTVRLSSAQTGGRTAVVEAFVPPGGGPPMHVHHREDETFFIIEGAIDFTASGATTRVGAGGCFFAPRGTPHRFQNTTDRPARMLFWVTPGGLDEYFAAVGTPLPAPDADPLPPTEADIKRLIDLAPEYGLEILPPGHGCGGIEPSRVPPNTVFGVRCSSTRSFVRRAPTTADRHRWHIRLNSGALMSGSEPAIVYVFVNREEPYVSITLNTTDEAASRLRDIFRRMAQGIDQSVDVSSMMECQTHRVRSFVFRVVSTKEDFRSFVRLSDNAELAGEFTTTTDDFAVLVGMCDAILEHQHGYHFLSFGSAGGWSEIILE